MNDIINIKCTRCGAILKIQENKSTLKCEFCGSEYVLEHKNDGIALQLDQISPSLDRAASEMAIIRLKEELAELDAQIQRKLENLEIMKKQAISEIEKRMLSSPSIEKLKNELNTLQQEQSLGQMKGKIRLFSFFVLNTSFGLAGGCVTFLVSFIVVFIVSAVIFAVISPTNNIPGFYRVFPFMFLTSIIIASIFLVVFAKSASRRQKKLSDEVSIRQRQLEGAINEQQRSIDIETTKHINLVNEQMANQKLAVEKEIEAAKASIKNEIYERQKQLDKHYNRVKI